MCTLGVNSLEAQDLVVNLKVFTGGDFGRRMLTGEHIYYADLWRKAEVLVILDEDKLRAEGYTIADNRLYAKTPVINLEPYCAQIHALEGILKRNKMCDHVYTYKYTDSLYNMEMPVLVEAMHRLLVRPRNAGKESMPTFMHDVPEDKQALFKQVFSAVLHDADFLSYVAYQYSPTSKQIQTLLNARPTALIELRNKWR